MHIPRLSGQMSNVIATAFTGKNCHAFASARDNDGLTSN